MLCLPALFTLGFCSLISSFFICCLDSIINACFCSWAGRFESYLVTNPWRQVFSWRCSNTKGVSWFSFLDGFGSTNDIINHPLALSDQSPMDGNHIDDFSGDYKGSNLSLNNTEVGLSKSTSFVIEKGKPTGHGMCLTTSDHDRLRIFIHEFTVRALIPWAERQMKLLSDVVSNFLSATNLSYYTSLEINKLNEKLTACLSMSIPILFGVQMNFIQNHIAWCPKI